MARHIDGRFWDTANSIALPTGNELAFGDFSAGRYAWELRNPIRFADPIPCTGRQGFWEVPDELVKDKQ